MKKMILKKKTIQFSKKKDTPPSKMNLRKIAKALSSNHS